MIKENIKVEKREREELPLLAEDIYQVELADITSKKVQTYDSKQDKELPVEYENIFELLFVILDSDDRGRYLFKNFVPSYLYIGKNGKNNLYQITEGLLGHELTPEEEATMDSEFLNNLVGKQCRVTVKHKVSGDKTYANIDTFLKAKEEKTALNTEEKEKAVLKDKEVTPSKEQMDEVKTGLADSGDGEPIPF